MAWVEDGDVKIVRRITTRTGTENLPPTSVPLSISNPQHLTYVHAGIMVGFGSSSTSGGRNFGTSSKGSTNRPRATATTTCQKCLKKGKVEPKITLSLRLTSSSTQVISRTNVNPNGPTSADLLGHSYWRTQSSGRRSSLLRTSRMSSSPSM